MAINAGHFAATFPASHLHAGPCVLRAVPTGDLSPHPPGAVSDPYQGPELAGTAFSLLEGVNHKIPVDYELESNTLGGRLELTSAGACGLAYSNLYSPLTLAESKGLFDCNAAIFSDLSDQPQPRAGLQIGRSQCLYAARGRRRAGRTQKSSSRSTTADRDAQL